MSTWEFRMSDDVNDPIVIDGLTIESVNILWSNGPAAGTTWKKQFRVLDGFNVIVEDILEPTDTFERYIARMKARNANHE